MAGGIWIALREDWKGILMLLAGIILVFIESGIIIDPDQKAIKQFTGIFFLKPGKWKGIALSTGIVVIKTKETQTMHVLSLSRSVTDDIYKLWLLMPGQNIELMSGTKSKILRRAEAIKNALGIDLEIQE